MCAYAYVALDIVVIGGGCLCPQLLAINARSSD